MYRKGKAEMGYYEKDGRLFDSLTHADRGPAKARLDADRTGVGETRIVQHPPKDACVGPGIPIWDPEHEDRNGNRTPLAAQTEMRSELSPEMIAVLKAAAIPILGHGATIGRSVAHLAQAMRQMPESFDPKRYEKTDLYWFERLAKAKDWLAVYDQGH